MAEILWQAGFATAARLADQRRREKLGAAGRSKTAGTSAFKARNIANRNATEQVGVWLQLSSHI